MSDFPNRSVSFNHNQHQQYYRQNYRHESDITCGVHLITTDLWNDITGESATSNMISQMCDITFSNTGYQQPLSSEAVQYVMKAKERSGSRQLQQEIEESTPEKRNEIFQALVSKIDELVFDTAANYVIQKLCEGATKEQQAILLRYFLPNAKIITDQANGCRVLQKFIENTSPVNVDQLYVELKPYLIDLCFSQNGNHIVQRFIDLLPARINEIIEIIKDHVIDLATDNCGCRVVQRIFEKFDISKLGLLVNEVNKQPVNLALNQYGNYVIQNILEKGPEEDVNLLIHAFYGHFYEFSIHKFASNVMEKCIRRVCNRKDSPEQRNEIFEEIIGKPNNHNEERISYMIKDQFGNYVIQRILEFGTEDQQTAIYDVLYSKYYEFYEIGYARHVISKLINIGYSFD